MGKETGIPGGRWECAKARKGGHEDHRCERRHTWFNWSKDFKMESRQSQDVVEKGPLCSSKEFRKGQRVTKGFKVGENDMFIFYSSQIPWYC